MATETKPSGSRVRSSNQDGSSSKGKVDYSSVNKKKIDSSIRSHSSDSKQLKSASNPTKIEVKSKTTSSSTKPASSSSKPASISSKIASISLKTTTTTTTRVREKKVFTLPGQKFDPPEEREPLRIFYESLWNQIPTSEMAEFCMELVDFANIPEGLGSKENDGPEGEGCSMDNTDKGTELISYVIHVVERIKKDEERSVLLHLEVVLSSLNCWMMEHGLLSPDRAKKAHERKQRKQMEIRLGIKTPIKTPNLTTSRPESSQRQQQASKNGDAKAKKRIIKDSDDDDDFILSPKRRKG
ncbi:hypothetical protein EZV62_013365 [Acer yangbiense]|uniref:Uncharacterized protein n=1 Tax=Acer yangbiense TaxID=1000413 RepID=A0A5C7I0T3_9ROSI|nr:hypothetical protein EZV62_013365 [Acer yangbiense]